MLSALERILRGWRVVIVSLGAWNIGASLYLMAAYTRGSIVPQTPYHRRLHVIGMVWSYVLLTAGLTAFIADRALDGGSLTWRLPLASVAFPLGAWGLWQMSFSKRKKED